MDLLTTTYVIIMVLLSLVWFIMAYKNTVKKDYFSAVMGLTTGVLALFGAFFILSKYQHLQFFVSILVIYVVVNFINFIVSKRKTNNAQKNPSN
jgi:multisubunit Na+/H+ antiporter MnhF subunit